MSGPHESGFALYLLPLSVFFPRHCWLPRLTKCTVSLEQERVEMQSEISFEAQGER